MRERTAGVVTSTTSPRVDRRPHQPPSPPLARLLELQRSAGNRAVAGLLHGTVQRFAEREHKNMGDHGSGFQMITLAPGLRVTFGDITALAGDYFGSVDQLRKLAAKPGDGRSKPGTSDEIQYALLVEVRKTKKAADFDDAVVKAVKRRYYTLAGTNVTHFSNPELADPGLSHGAKAAKRDTRKLGQISQEVREAYGLSTNPKDAGKVAGTPVSNAGSYRMNHELAIQEAARAGAGSLPLDAALLYEGFASHFLTDAYASGHVRTPRRSISDWWNPRVPMFWHNLKLWMAEGIAQHMNDHSKAGALTVQYLYEQAQDVLNSTLKKKGIPPLTFGDVISGAVHDLDNDKGLMADVGGDIVQLVGDGKVISKKDRRTVTHVKTHTKAVAGVKVSLQDIRDAEALGRAGKTPAQALAALALPDGLYRAEQLWPRALADTDPRQTTPMARWQVPTWEDLFTTAQMRKAMRVFANEKADDLGGEIELDPPLKAAKEAALKDAVLKRLKGGEKEVQKVFTEVINYTPGSIGGTGGILGHDADDDALSYYQEAKRKGALDKLTVQQRKRLVRLVLDGATRGDEETMIADLLTSNRAHVNDVMRHVGWRWVYDDVGGDNLKRIVRGAGPVFWPTQPFERKKLEVKFLADGRTDDTDQETMIIILRTCSAEEVRRIDSAVGGWGGLKSDLDGKWRQEFLRMKAR